MTQATVAGIAPFFIVKHVPTALSFYCDKLGFELVYKEPEAAPFFAIVRRDAAMILIKKVAADPLPNCKRDPEARWDAYASVANPDALAAEFRSRGVVFARPVRDTHDGLRGFELEDEDGHVLFFGRPR
jgi:catechol 2,3-dioxygenase-like lactoylglutathione lyase family enzyme